MLNLTVLFILSIYTYIHISTFCLNSILITLTQSFILGIRLKIMQTRVQYSMHIIPNNFFELLLFICSHWDERLSVRPWWWEEPSSLIRGSIHPFPALNMFLTASHQCLLLREGVIMHVGLIFLCNVIINTCNEWYYPLGRIKFSTRTWYHVKTEDARALPRLCDCTHTRFGLWLPNAISMAITLSLDWVAGGMLPGLPCQQQEMQFTSLLFLPSLPSSQGGHTCT